MCSFSSFNLHIIAMFLMLLDHMWETIIPGQQWMTWLGRLSFPIFAFLIVKGYFHTKNFKKYISRLFIFALLSEIPFNLLVFSTPIFPFQQNVLWTFIYSLLTMRLLDKIKGKYPLVLEIGANCFIVFIFYMLGTITFSDYGGHGVLTVLVFYFFKDNKLAQLICMFVIHGYLMSGLNIQFELFNTMIEFPQQAFAVLSLPIIWSYNNKQGPHNKYIQFFYYAFYPLHMLILGLMSI